MSNGNNNIGTWTWDEIRENDRPKGDLAMNAYLDLPEPQPTYVDVLDNLLGGGMTRGVTVIGGESSAGKSVLACQVAAMLAAHGKRVVYASYEMSWEVVQLRCASAWSLWSQDIDTPIKWSEISSGWARERHDEENPTNVYKGKSREELSRYLVGSKDPIVTTLYAWDEGPGRNLAVLTSGNDVCELCDNMSAIEGEKPILVIDYLQIVPSGANQEQSEYQRVTDVINRLQEYAYSEDGSTVLAVSSIKKLNSQEKKGGPSMDWFRGSGYIGYAAEQAVMLTVDRKLDGEGNMSPIRGGKGQTYGRMTVIKNKSGSSGISRQTELYGWHNWMCDIPKEAPEE